MNKNPFISVIINCHNGQEFLREAIDSVYLQTYKNWEIIFWDNASNDESAIIAQSYDSKLKYFRGDKLVSLGTARNCALDECNGELIAFLDSDDRWYRNKIETQVSVIVDNEVGLVYTFSENYNMENKIDDVYTFRSVNDLVNNYDIGMSSAMIDRRILNKLSDNFDLSLKQAEEFDLFIRLSCISKVIRINKYLTYYRQHDNMLSRINYGLEVYEKEYSFLKLYLNYPEACKKNGVNIDKMREINIWPNFKARILIGDGIGARRILLPYIGKKAKYFTAFLLSYFSTKILVSIWNLQRKKHGKPIVTS